MISRNTYKPIWEARENSYSVDFNKYTPRKPKMEDNVKVFSTYNLETLAGDIDWRMFFHAWGLKGRFPEILEEDSKKGREARRLYREGQEMLGEMIEGDKVEARAVIGVFPAAGHHDDILVYTDDQRKDIRAALPMLRQQKYRSSRDGFLSLSDYVAPESSGINDYIGTFACSAGFGAEEHIKKFEQQGDSYNSVMFRLICDRLTEAFSEVLHREVRYKYWGYACGKPADGKELLKKPSEGIRPSPGYPSCPDHSLKQDIFHLMDVENTIGIQLKSSYAMHPSSSVCGFYFAMPQSKYFNLGKILGDQVSDYAKRRSIPEESAKMLFKPFILNDSQ
ncbi:MAG: vitamin B12 dependent-methionine synthase activation domain-containing protein [Bacteroidales bacterium]